MSAPALTGALLGGALATSLMVIATALGRITQPRLVTRALEASGIAPPRTHIRVTHRFTFSRRPGLVPIAVGVLIGALLAIAFISRGAAPLLIVLGPFLGGMAGHLVHGQIAAHQRKKHQQAIAVELPTVLELLSLAVAGGETFPAALERVGTISAGPVGRGARNAAREMTMGAPWEPTLRAWAQASRSSDIERFVDRVVISLERGTPMADVLRAQAADARVRHRNALVELAGRKDVAMLVPVVFLILPTVVLIALFPGARALTVLTG